MQENETATIDRGDPAIPRVELVHPDIWIESNPATEKAIIENILPAQPGEFMIISGRTGIGKSNLMLRLLYSLGTGTDFFGFKVTKTTAGLLIMEGDRNNLKERIDKVRSCCPPSADIGIALSLETKPLEKNLEYYTGIFKGRRVVMLDNLKQVSTSERLKNEYASNWVTAFHKFLKELGAVGVITHHVKKPNPNSLIEPGDVYELKGATEYVDDAAAVLLLEREKQQRGPGGHFLPADPNALALYFAKTRIAERTLDPVRLRRNYETAGFDIV